MSRRAIGWLCGLGILWGFAAGGLAAGPGGATATTETNCNFGMAKGEAQQSCQVPIPSGCAVARFPGTTTPWTNISKGGNFICRFDEKKTDWKTTITGTCSRCRSPQCSARFSVMFDCSATAAPYTPQTR
ncbi:hypothetical protein [Nitrospira sp. Kam-Ns4a]